jgi:hypothetical protein
MLLARIVTHRVPIQPFHCRDGHASRRESAARPSHRVLVLIKHWSTDSRSPLSWTGVLTAQPQVSSHNPQSQCGIRGSYSPGSPGQQEAKTVSPVSHCCLSLITQRSIAPRIPNKVCTSQLLLCCSFMKKAGLFKAGFVALNVAFSYHHKNQLTRSLLLIYSFLSNTLVNVQTKAQTFAFHSWIEGWV